MIRAELVIESRLAATEEMLGYCYLPRIIRVCRKFNFSKNEARIAIYCLIRRFSNKLKKPTPSRHRRRSKVTFDSVEICQFLEIPIMEFLHFLRKDRPHMKQELFYTFRDSDANLAFKIVYDADHFNVLVGSKVTAEMFTKLEQNFLAHIVAEEPGNEHLK